MIKVIDSIMGSGKSTAMLEYVKNNKNEKYLWITPFLSEVERVMNYEGIGFQRPIGSVTEERERATELGLELDVVRGVGIPKKNQILHLMRSGSNVVSTHESFSRMGVLDIASEYTLVLDEVMSFVSCYNIKMQTVNVFEREGYITIDPYTGKITPTEKGLKSWSNSERNIADFIRYSDMGLLYKSKRKVIITEYPIELLTKFKKVYILTYLFEGSYLKAFMDMHGATYEKMIVKGDLSLVDWNERVYFDQIKKIASLINIHGENTSIRKKNYNEEVKKAIGTLSSSSAQKMNKSECIKLNNIIKGYARSISATSDGFIYTVYKEVYNKAGVSIKGYSNSFLPYNLKATNEYRHTSSVAYCVARRLNPVLKSHMESRADDMGNKVLFNEKLLALGDLLQFVFRSCIRDENPIELFVPDKMTRVILLEWLGGTLI
ncbi:MAG: hypothetical protein ACRC0G_05960 [Fusobacteriaceae bacterium]